MLAMNEKVSISRGRKNIEQTKTTKSSKTKN